MKTIYTETQKKRMGERKAKYQFGVEDEEGFVTTLTFKQFMAHEAEYKEPGEHVQKEVMKALLAQIASFRDKIEYNTWSKQNSPTFLEKVEKLLDMGAKWSKSGILSV
ncbi:MULTISPECIES: hypothetical protein [Vibrio]|uniref:hypothetical protein n=1 Tax=Vibrio TaxID=662 RepID=UPI0005F2103D|nr:MULTISPECIES: hypothetical protein [Vibrio]EGR2217578.1 hypothetical protein [Vibrio parahaemolyticus]MBE4202996.1 hypothetical protein [Vibrio parahaemolyticus]MCX8796062.1 hypothetical protein [Vibrio parahaemolyticus]TBT51406.1 hypothetical protein D5E78_06305 [Vibrio parahaemolyticus]